MNPTRRRRKNELARDRRRIAELYLRGWLQVDIAEELGISQPTVSNDLSHLHDQWLDSALIDYDEAKARELAKIDNLERQAWESYLLSCDDAETMTRKEKRLGSGSSGQVVQQELTSVSRGQKPGDPRFLVIIDKCIERRCKIFGLDAPEKRELSGPGGMPLLPSGTDHDTIRVIVHGDDHDN